MSLLLANSFVCCLLAAAAGQLINQPAAAGGQPAIAGDVPDQSIPLHLRVAAQDGVRKGLRFLVVAQQAGGGWSAFDRPHLGVTALVVKCIVQDEAYGPTHPVARRAVDFILKHVQPDGGIYIEGEGLRNYYTSVALMALAATKDARHRDTITSAQHFLKKLQWDGGEGHEVSSTWYGGQGYGSHKRPDLSNTQMMLEALHQSGLPTDDPVYQKAMVFIARSQMLDGTNDQPLADGSDEGGFIYTPVGGGESKAGTTTGGDRPRLRSYGSMTYAGFKSMLYAKLDRNDVRVERALEWIRRHYTLDVNPNMPGAQSREGLYYYYHVFARAMKAWEEEVITDAAGAPHHWRAELCEKLVSLQRDDGSWVNESDRWYEGNPRLVSAYAILALQTALSP